jgi:hypothetical protein
VRPGNEQGSTLQPAQAATGAKARTHNPYFLGGTRDHNQRNIKGYDKKRWFPDTSGSYYMAYIYIEPLVGGNGLQTKLFYVKYII